VSEIARRYPGWGGLLASLPLFVALPLLLRSGLGFWASMGIVIAGTLALYALMFWAGPRLGLKL
jgi:cytosine/uracil/thiamine/allantoin permease